MSFKTPQEKLKAIVEAKGSQVKAIAWIESRYGVAISTGYMSRILSGDKRFPEYLADKLGFVRGWLPK